MFLTACRVPSVSLPCPRVRKNIKILDTYLACRTRIFVCPSRVRVRHETRQSKNVSVYSSSQSISPPFCWSRIGPQNYPLFGKRE